MFWVVLGCSRLFQVVQLLWFSWFLMLLGIMSGCSGVFWTVLVALGQPSSSGCIRPLWFVILFQIFSWFYSVDWLKLLEIVSICSQ